MAVTLGQSPDYSPLPLWIWLGSSIVADSIITGALGKHVTKVKFNLDREVYNKVTNRDANFRPIEMHPPVEVTME